MADVRQEEYKKMEERALQQGVTEQQRSELRKADRDAKIERQREQNRQERFRSQQASSASSVAAARSAVAARPLSVAEARQSVSSTQA